MSFIAGLFCFVFAMFIGSIFIAMLNWIGVIAHFGHWIYYVSTILVVIIACYAYGIGSGYVSENEDNIIFSYKKFLKRNPWMQIIILFLILSAIGYFSYHVWLYCETKYPFKVAIFITIINVLFNIIFLSNFFRMWRNLVTSSQNSGGMVLTSIIALIVVAWLDYSYLIAPAMGWDKIKNSNTTTISKRVQNTTASEPTKQTTTKQTKKKIKKNTHKKKAVASTDLSNNV